MPLKSLIFPQRQWVADRYGSYRGFLYTWWHRLLYLLGRYRGYRRVDWMAVERLVFVCKGNICRSAYAEAFALGRGLTSSSCGMDTREGVEADGDAIQAARLRGIDLSPHRAMPIQSMSRPTKNQPTALRPLLLAIAAQMAPKTHRTRIITRRTAAASMELVSP